MTSTLPASPVTAPPGEIHGSAADPDPGRHTPAAEPPSGRRWPTRLLRGRAADPAWVRPALLVLLVATGVLYLWGLGASGWANSFYSAAVQAGSQSWQAFFFGSSDAANFITVDKTPASLWVMDLSARIFGVNSWSILVPQALEGVAAVGLLYATVRRWYSPAAGLLAGAVLASTPVAALMFRFNNPDALLVLLMVAAVYAIVRAIENGSTKWLMLAGVFLGFGFLTKMLQVLLVVPPLALAYLIAGPPRLGKRIGQLLLAGVALVVSAGWWILAVELWPEDSRPYIGGSQNNSILELTLGYNGLGRLSGNETGSVGGGGGGGGWGETGWLRLFDSAQGGQIAWLLPAALVLLVVGLVITARRPRTDRTRAGFVLWGGWLVVTALVFSFMQGIFHAYYTVALAPAIGAVIGMGAHLLWQRRRNELAAATLALVTSGTAVWAYVLLGRSADWQPWLRVAVLIAGIAASVGILATSRLSARFARPIAVLAIISALAAPIGYSINTAATAHTGSIPSAGPAVAGGQGGPGGGQGGGPGGGPGGGAPGGMGDGGGQTNGNGQQGFPGGQTNGNGPTNGNGQTAGGGQPTGGGRGNGGMGGLLNGSEPSDELVAALSADADSYTWAAAAVGSNNASGYQLATGEPVMAIGGFNGTDPTPTLAEFQQYVADGQIHYFIGSGGGGFGGGGGNSGSSSEIATWVQENFTAQTVGGSTVYDLTSPATAS